MSEFYTNVESIGKNIVYRGYDSAGRKFFRREYFEPSVYRVSYDYGKTPYTTIMGEPLIEKRDDMPTIRKFIREMNDIDGVKLYGMENFKTQFIQEKWPNQVPYDTEFVDALVIDLEVNSSNGFPDPNDASAMIEIIGCKSTKDKIYRIWSVYQFDYELAQENTGLKVEPHIFDNEDDMIESFIDYYSAFENVPDVITGWNSDWFDIPYLANRIINTKGENALKRLSPFHSTRLSEREEMNRTRTEVTIHGVSNIDSLDAFKKFVRSYGPQASYSLDEIAKVVLGEGKLKHEYATLAEFAKNDPQKYVEYNIIDVNRTERIIKETNLVDLMFSMAYMMKSNISDILGTVTIWDNKIYEYLHQNGMRPPFKSPGVKEKFDGAYVKEPIIGKHKWLATYDVASLYPHIIIQWNMSPETIVDKHIDVDPIDDLLHTYENIEPPKNCNVAITGQAFRNDINGIIPLVIQNMYDTRKKAKNTMIDLQKRIQETDDHEHKKNLEIEMKQWKNLEQSVKINMNSLYGALGNAYFRYFDIRMARAITAAGQFIIKFSEKVSNDVLNNVMKDSKDRVVAIDTDSCMVTYEDVINKHLQNASDDKKIKMVDQFSEKYMIPAYKKAYEHLASSLGCSENKITMEREVISDASYFQGKKRYFMNVIDNEGVRNKERELKIKGIEAVKSSTPDTVKNALKETFYKILYEDENALRCFCEDYRKEFMKCNYDEIAIPTSANNHNKWTEGKYKYKKGTPISVRAALNFNRYIYENDLSIKYRYLITNEKIKYVFLKKPNPIFNENVVGFSTELPVYIHRYIDYNKLYDRLFLNIVDSLVKPMGWDIKSNDQTLESIFG